MDDYEMEEAWDDWVARLGENYGKETQRGHFIAAWKARSALEEKK